MKVTITGAVPIRGGLRLALRVEHEKAGWIRFNSVVLLVSDLSLMEREYLTAALDHAASEESYAEQVPLPLTW